MKKFIIIIWTVTSIYAGGEELQGIYLDGFYLKIPFGTFVDDKKTDFLNPAEGTIEFWIKTGWVKKNTTSLFFWGKASNMGSISISAIKSHYICFAIAAENYKRFTVRYKLPDILRSEAWHHLAFCWNITGKQKPRITTFIDGKLLQAKISTIHPEYKFFPLNKNPVPIYLGTGKYLMRLIENHSPEIRIAQFRISRGIRYEADFTPSEKTGIDDDTLLYFPFDKGNLSGSFPDGKKENKITVEKIKIQ